MRCLRMRTPFEVLGRVWAVERRERYEGNINGNCRRELLEDVGANG